MTKDEWLEMVEWVDDRWASRSWDQDQARAYWKDLKHMDAADVWDALAHLYKEGREYPPTGSVLTARAIDIQITRLRAAAPRAIPVNLGGDGGWAEWRDRLGYGGLSMEEATRLSHRRHNPKGCDFEGCDICAEVRT